MPLLEEYVELLRAPLFRNEQNGTHPLRIASISDFPCCGYLPTPRRTVVLLGDSHREASRYTLLPYDVLLTIVGTVGRLAILPETVSEEWVPATNIVILRFREPSPPGAMALYLYFRTEAGRKTVGELVHGKSIPLVSKKALAKVPLPTLGPEVREDAAALFRQEVGLYTTYLRDRQELAARVDRFFYESTAETTVKSFSR